MEENLGSNETIKSNKKKPFLKAFEIGVFCYHNKQKSTQKQKIMQKSINMMMFLFIYKTILWCVCEVFSMNSIRLKTFFGLFLSLKCRTNKTVGVRCI